MLDRVGISTRLCKLLTLELNRKYETLLKIVFLVDQATVTSIYELFTDSCVIVGTESLKGICEQCCQLQYIHVKS